MLKSVIETFFKKHAKNLFDQTVTLNGDSPFDPYDAHLIDEVQTAISEGSFFTGTLDSSTPIRIDGRFSGHLSTRELTIGQSGVVEADLNLFSATIEGKVLGNITVDDHLTITASAHIDGDIVTGTLTLEEGAIITGSITVHTEDFALAT